MSEVIHASEAARRVSVSPSTIGYWISSGLLPCTRVGKKVVLVNVDDLIAANAKSMQQSGRRRFLKQ